MSDIGEITARLTLKSDQFQVGMRKARESMSQTGKAAQQASKDFDKISTASMAVGAAVATGVTAAVVSASRFEAALSKLSAISGATGADLEALRQTALDFGESTQYDAVQTAEALTFLAQSGFSVKEQIAALPAVLNAAAASGIDLASSANIVSNIMSGFQIAAEDTSGAVDVLVKTVTTANTDLPQLGEAFKMVGPVAKSLGLSIEETAASIAAMSNSGIQGSEAGTALRAAMLSLVSPVGEGAKAMKSLGIEVTDASGNMKELPDLVGHIASKLEGMTDAQKTAAVSALVGREASAGFLAVLESGEETLANYVKELENAGGTAERVAKTQMDNLKGAVEELSGSLETLSITVGEDFIPVMTDVARKVADTIGGMSELDIANLKAGMSFTGTAAAIGLAASTLGKLGLAARSLMVSMGPAGWLIAGMSILGGVIAGVVTKNKELDAAMLANLKTQHEEIQTLDQSIARYEELQGKSKLTADEYERFVDINSQLQKTADPELIARLKREQDDLSKKSKLSNDELNEMVGLNGELIEKVPQATAKITDQGNAILENTQALKEYSKEKLESLYQDLDLQRLATESEYLKLIEQESNLVGRIKDINGEKEDLINKQTDAQTKLNDEQSKLLKMQGDSKLYSQQEIEAQKTRVKLAEDDVELAVERVSKQAQLVIKKQNELEETRKTLAELEDVRYQMAHIVLTQQGLNAKKGEELQTINQAIDKLEAQKRKLQETTPIAQRNTGEYAEAVGHIEDQIAQLQGVKNQVIDITGKASAMNAELAKDIRKTIEETRIQRIIQSGSGPRVSGPQDAGRSRYHTGGIVGKPQMPKLHTGGLAAQFANMPNHNEIDVRLLRDEMVLTEAQQANLMRMIDAGLTSGESSESLDGITKADFDRLARAMEYVASRPVSVEIDGRQVANATIEDLDNLMAMRTRNSLRARGL